MKSIRLLDRRVGYSLASLGLLLSMVAPVALPALASAAVMSQRSITMSTSAVEATGTSYTLKFTAATGIGATEDAEGGVVVDFCSESPLIGEDCTVPTGMSTTGATIDEVKYANSAVADGTLSATTNGHVVWTAGAAYTGGTAFEMTLSGITNPTNAGTFYARVTTYADKTRLDTANAIGVAGNYNDEGAIALAATEGIGVDAFVLETMTFCVSGEGDDPENPAPAPGANCDPDDLVNPSMVLGEDMPGGKALNVGNLSTGTVYAQLSTNASGGAVVNLKSNAVGCGGLFRNGNTSNCNITAQNTPSGAGDTITAGTAKFGLTVGASADAPGATATAGALAPAGSYSSSKYFMDFAANNETGVTSSYGSQLFSSNGAPVSNKYVPITFGASIDNSTPAGSYGATLNMIATGTF